MWSVGGTIDEKGRENFSNYIKKLMKETLKCENKKDKLVKFDKLS
jgi:hypothetical protein